MHNTGICCLKSVLILKDQRECVKVKCVKVKFGDIGFCMGKSENYLFFWKQLQP